VAVRRPSARPSSPGESSLSSSSGRIPVPKHNKDPVWSLAPWPVEVTINGQLVTVPAVPAVDWLVYLLKEVPDVDGLIMDLMPEVEDVFLDSELPLDGLYELVLDILETVSARSWWITLRLIGVAVSSWGLLGPEMQFHGVDANVVSLAAWLDALMMIMLQNMDSKDVTMFIMRLETPPLNVETPEPEMSRAAFLSLTD
jgi:hypothetical protein